MIIMDKKAVSKEHKRLEMLLEQADVPRQKREMLASVIDNMAWQRIKLDEAREQMQNESLACHYDNGGGQEGERENPFFKAYGNLWRAYMIGLEKFSSCLPKEMQEEAESEGVTILEQVMKMKKVSA